MGKPFQQGEQAMSRGWIMTGVLFIALVGIGLTISSKSPIQNDEHYTQVASIHHLSYVDQISGRIPEGGNAPLFYFLQKLFLQVIHYQTPAQWLQQRWDNDAGSQIALRIIPVICMSLSVVLVFHYFCRSYSLGIGFYSLFIYFSSYMLWAYWAQARPYALLVFLTTAQSVVFLKGLEKCPGTNRDKSWVMLAGINLLLGLTSTLSLGEILAVSAIWWAFKERDWKKYIWITLLPVLIVLFYYAYAPKYQFYFGLSPEQLIRDNVSRDRFDIVFIFLILLAVDGWRRKIQWSKPAIGEEIKKPLPYLIFMALVLASSAAVLGLFALHAKPGQGFAISSRYFIYLTPIGVFATTLLTVSLVRSFSKYRLLQWILAGLFVLVLSQRFIKIFPKIMYFMRGG